MLEEGGGGREGEGGIDGECSELQIQLYLAKEG